MRPPVVADLDPGAGAPLLAAALHGVDAGAWAGGPVDVLVARAGGAAGPVPARVPVLVLVTDDPVPAPGPPGGPVLLPVVPQWLGPDGVRAAAGVLRLTWRETPVALRPAAAALRAVVAALLRSGALERPCRVPSLPPPPPPSPPLSSPPLSSTSSLSPPPSPSGGVPVRGPVLVVVRRPRAAAVLVHRAAPVVPRLVAGAPVRWVRSAPVGSGSADPGPVGSGRGGCDAAGPGGPPVAPEPLEPQRTGVEPVAGGPAAPVRRRTLRAGLVPAGTGGPAPDRGTSGAGLSGSAVRAG